MILSFTLLKTVANRYLLLNNCQECVKIEFKQKCERFLSNERIDAKNAQVVFFLKEYDFLKH